MPWGLAVQSCFMKHVSASQPLAGHWAFHHAALQGSCSSDAGAAFGTLRLTPTGSPAENAQSNANLFFCLLTSSLAISGPIPTVFHLSIFCVVERCSPPSPRLSPLPLSILLCSRTTPANRVSSSLYTLYIHCNCWTVSFLLLRAATP